MIASKTTILHILQSVLVEGSPYISIMYMHNVITNLTISIFSFEMVNGLDDAILTISPFLFEDEGTYVCRTENIAGIDADIVSLIAGKLNSKSRL